MLHVLVLTLEIYLAYAGFSILCCGVWFVRLYRRDHALEAERPSHEKVVAPFIVEDREPAQCGL